jgi:hypothetical protein
VRIIKRVTFTVFLALFCTAQGANISEYAVKASYLSNFADYVKWPKTAFPDENSPIVLGILGEDPFGSTLDDAIKGKTTAGRALTIKRFNSFDKDQMNELRNCHILFISVSEQDNVREILSNLKGAKILTVSEIDRFPTIGGIVKFNQEGDIIGLVVNKKNAIMAGLKLSSKLLKVSKIYLSVNKKKVKALYYEGVQLYMNGEIKAAIKKWKECLIEDPGYVIAQDEITKARAKLKAISAIK